MGKSPQTNVMPVMMFNTNESAGVTPRPRVAGSSECDTAISRSFL